ncbi:uncharacterized protein LOC144083484 isoform X2 [Stigmatopora argus]
MRPDDDTAGGQILTDLREEPADRPREQLGQMHVATAFVVPGALDNVEEEQEEKNGVQPTHPPTSQGLLASPRDSRGFEPCPRHWADVDVDEGDWQNNATMRFLDSRRFWWECNSFVAGVQEYVCGVRTSFYSVVSLPAEGGERHQEYICGTRTSIHSAVGAYSTVCAKGPTHTPTKLGPAKYFRDKLEEAGNLTNYLLYGMLVLYY